MTMIINTHCKRLLAPYADLLEPIHKRRCVDMRSVGSEDFLQDGFVSSSAFACAEAAAEGSLDRRRPSLQDLQEFAPDLPAEKRMRLDAGLACPSDLGSTGAGDQEVAIRGWAEALVRSLQNCPSTEEATQRSARILRDFESEVKQSAIAEGDVVEAASEGALQSMQQTKKVLMRAVHHLAQRCRELQASAGEAEELKEALDRTQEEKRRMAHANELLKGHLRLYVDGHH